MSKELKYYWSVKTKNEDIHLYADSVKNENGDLIFYHDRLDIPVFSFSKGYWQYFYAASCIDGGAVYVEHWSKLKDEE